MIRADAVRPTSHPQALYGSRLVTRKPRPSTNQPVPVSTNGAGHLDAPLPAVHRDVGADLGE